MLLTKVLEISSQLYFFFYAKDMQDKYIKFISFLKRTSSKANKHIGTCSGESNGYYRFHIEIWRKAFTCSKANWRVGITVEFVYGVFQCNNSRGNEMKLLSVRTFSIVACGSITVQSGCLQIPKLWTKKHSRESLTKFSSGTVLLHNVVSFSLGMQLYKIPLSKRRCDHWKVLVDQ